MGGIALRDLDPVGDLSGRSRVDFGTPIAIDEIGSDQQARQGVPAHGVVNLVAGFLGGENFECLGGGEAMTPRPSGHAAGPRIGPQHDRARRRQHNDVAGFEQRQL